MESVSEKAKISISVQWAGEEYIIIIKVVQVALA